MNDSLQLPVQCMELEQDPSGRGSCTLSTTAPRLSESETRSHLSRMEDRPGPGQNITQ